MITDLLRVRRLEHGRFTGLDRRDGGGTAGKLRICVAVPSRPVHP
ncbi:MAG TPA: hypothetical protein VGD29_01955 [Actinoplanes sp.]